MREFRSARDKLVNSKSNNIGPIWTHHGFTNIQQENTCLISLSANLYGTFTNVREIELIVLDRGLLVGAW